MNAQSEDMKDVLVAESSLGLDFDETGGGNLFISDIPEDAKTLVVGLFDREGLSPDMRLDETGGDGIGNPSLEVEVHGERGGYIAAMALSRAIYDVLHGFANTEVNGTNYLLIRATGEPAGQGNDGRGRPVIVTRYLVTRTAA